MWRVWAAMGAFAMSQPACAQLNIEVDQLLAAVRSSQCQFEREGRQFSGSDAAEHLMQKFRRGPAAPDASADVFIELAGSASSISGRPYIVHCTGEAPRLSNAWLKSQLKGIRGANAKVPQARP